MIADIHSLSPNNQNRQQRGAPKWRALLYARGLSDAAIERAGLRSDNREHGWLFPYTPDGQAQRWKAFPGRKGPKSLWHPSKPADARLYDPQGDLAAHIAAAGGALILAEGEPDVWACWSAGIYNVTATMHGAGAIPAWLLDELRQLNVRRVLIWPDRDAAGLKGAAKLRAMLADSEIRLDVRALPSHLGEKGDIGNLLQTVGADRLAAALEACPALALPESRPVTPLNIADRASSPPPGEGSDLYERWCLEVEQVAIRVWQIALPNQKGQSRKNFSSPFREDNNPSAQWSYSTHGFKDYATGEFTNTKQVAELLGLPSWEDFKRECRPAPALQAAARVTATRFPHGLPYTLNKRYLNAHRRISVKKQIAAAAVDYLYHQVPQEALPDGHWLSAGGFRHLLCAEGYEPESHLCATGLDQLAAWGRVERLEVEQVEWLEAPEGSIGKKCNLYTSTGKVYRLQFLVVPPTGPAPQVIFRFRPWSESLDAIDQRWRILARERRYASTPDDVHPEWGDLADEEIALWDDWRAPLYEAWSAERKHAASQYERDLAYLEADFDRIRAGSYHPVALPEGVTLRNTRHYADALKAARVAGSGEKGISTRRLAYETGRSYSAEARARERVEVIAVPQTRAIPAEQVTDYQRACGLVLEERGGQAVVKAPSVEKLAVHATPEELAAAESVSQAQRERGKLSAASRRRERVREAAPAPQFKAPDRPGRKQLETIPDGYSDDHLRAQYSMHPLPPGFQPYDPETGELYEPRCLWKEGARWLESHDAAAIQTAAEVSEANNVSGFLELSEPREHGEITEGTGPRPDATESGASLPAGIVGTSREQEGAGAAHCRTACDPSGLPGADRAGSRAFSSGDSGEPLEPALSHSDCDPGWPGTGADRPTHRGGPYTSMGQGKGDHRARAGGGVGHICAMCGAPADELHLFGWLCSEHYTLPLSEKLARLRSDTRGLHDSLGQGGS